MPLLTGHLQPRRNWPTLASTILITHPILRIWPHRTTTCSLEWKKNWKVAIFRLTRRLLLPRRPGWTDLLIMFFFWVACKSYSNGLSTALSFVENMSNESRVWLLWLVSFLVGLRTYQHPLVYCPNITSKFCITAVFIVVKTEHAEVPNSAFMLRLLFIKLFFTRAAAVVNYCRQTCSQIWEGNSTDLAIGHPFIFKFRDLIFFCRCAAVCKAMVVGKYKVHKCDGL